MLKKTIIPILKFFYNPIPYYISAANLLSGILQKVQYQTKQGQTVLTFVLGKTRAKAQ